jgi:hypothetical protein
MKRMLLAAATSSMLALAAPSLALAAHHAKCHGRSHHACAHVRRAHHASLRNFGAPLSSTGTTTAGATPTAPTDETAGKVVSFEGGVLTIKLNDESTVSGKVTEQTEIQCQSGTPPTEGSDDEDGGDEASGDDGGDSSSHVSSGLSSQGDDMSSGDGSGDGEQSQQACTSAALIPGAVVREAELSVGSAGSVWDHIDLIS